MVRRLEARRAAGALLALASLFGSERALAQQDAGLSIETGSPDALCPELANTRAAVRRRLGQLIVPGGSSGFRARYTIAHAPVGSPRDFVRLELYGPKGDLQLSRDLPLAGEACSTMAEVIALVLDRHFRALLAHEPEPVPPAPITPPPSVNPPSSAAPPSTAPEAGATVRPTVSRPASIAEGEMPALALESSPQARLRLLAFELALRSPDLPAFGLRVTLEPWPDVYLATGVHVGFRSEAEELPDGGVVSSRGGSWRIGAGWGPTLGAVRTYIGPSISLGLEHGASNGLEEDQSGTRGSLATGVDTGALWVTDDGWALGASAALYAFVLGGRFVIDQQDVLKPDPVRAWFGMSVGHVF